MQVKRDIKEVKEMEFVRQSELAELNGVRPSTVKYYSELGLLPYQQHGQGLSKFYNRIEARKRLQKILELKKKGKTLNEIISKFIT